MAAGMRTMSAFVIGVAITMWGLGLIYDEWAQVWV